MNKLIKAFLTCTIIFLAGCNLFPEKSKKPVIYTIARENNSSRRKSES